MAVVIDFTKQNISAVFTGSSEEDVSYAKNFWQSIQLHPPMESRLVSSDIKQRLKIAPPSSQARNLAHSVQEEPAALQDFMTRAKTIERFEEYERLQKFAEAKVEGKTLLHKHREIRKKKEEISKERVIPPKKEESNATKTEEYELDNETEDDVLQQLTEFDNYKFGSQDSDSD